MLRCLADTGYCGCDVRRPDVKIERERGTIGGPSHSVKMCPCGEGRGSGLVTNRLSSGDSFPGDCVTSGVMCPSRVLTSSSSSSSLSVSSMMLLLMLVAMVCVTGVNSVALTPLVHMTNHCHRSIYVNDSIILDLTENLKADRVLVGHLSCAVTLHAPPGARLYLHVLQLAISDRADMPDRLHIYEVSSTGQKTRRLTPSTGLYGVLERPFLIFNTAGIIVPDFRTAGPRMYLDYQGKPTIVYRGFRVLITVFYTPGPDGACRPGTLHCPYAGTCVPTAVRCDGLPNCGLDDSSDEKSCQREYVVSDILEEYSTRTAVIAGVTGILVFLGVAALVLLVVIKYNRKKYSRGTDQTVRFTSRGGGACRYANETDLTNLYAPPSYEDVMTPSGKIAFHGRQGPRHSGPPPAYSAAVAALIHKESAASSDEEAGPRSHGKHRSAASKDNPQSLELQHLRGACAASSDEDVRMHGTWPSDTDEEEEVRARRRRKGGKRKGKSRQDEVTTTGSSSAGPRQAKTKQRALSPDYENTRPQKASSEEPLRDTEPSSSPDSHSDCSPSHQGCLSTASSDVASGRGSRGAEDVVSETESQLASSKRNSRTESNSPDGSNSSIHSASPAKKPAASEDARSATKHQPPPASILPSGKYSTRTASDDSLNLKAADLNDLNKDNDEEEVVDLNPLKN